MIEHTAYKVLTIDMKSFLVEELSKKYCIQYSKYSIIKCFPNSLGIFCFNTFHNAIKFRDEMNKIGRIFKVIGYNPITPYKINGSLFTDYLDKFYKNLKNDRMGVMISGYYPFPVNDTVCFRSIKLIKEITYFHK